MVNATVEILSRLVSLHACTAKKLQSRLLGHDGTLAPFDKAPFQCSHPGFFKETTGLESGRVTTDGPLIFPWQWRREQLRLKAPPLQPWPQKYQNILISKSTIHQAWIQSGYLLFKYIFSKHLTLTLMVNHCKISGYNRRNHCKNSVWSSLFQRSSLVLENEIFQVLENKSI